MSGSRPDDGGVSAAVSRHRTLVLIRWCGLAFGIAQVLAYDMQEYPPGIREAALAVLGALAVTNIVFTVAIRRLRTADDVRRLAIASLVMDGLIVSAFPWLYAFDPLSAMFALLFFIPIEGAVHFQLRGALWSWVGIAILYVGRENFGVQFGNPFEWTSLTYRLGLLFLVALTVGLITRQLALESERSRRALAELRRIELWRTRLLGMLGHDLRGPLAAIQSMAATVAAAPQALSPDEVRDLSRRIAGQSNRLLALSADLLELARREQDTLVLERRDVRLADVVATAIESVGHDEETVVAVARELTVAADPDRLGQVVANLVLNAHRHGTGPVEVEGWRHDREVVLSVRDHGPGVPAAQRDQLFDPFTGGGSDGSVGLGLWIVRSVVDAHGGTVAYDDAQPGARFTVSLPDVVTVG